MELLICVILIIEIHRLTWRKEKSFLEYEALELYILEQYCFSQKIHVSLITQFLLLIFRNLLNCAITLTFTLNFLILKKNFYVCLLLKDRQTEHECGRGRHRI